MEYELYAQELRRAADYFQREHPELPDVVATYLRSAETIEELLAITSELNHRKC